MPTMSYTGLRGESSGYAIVERMPLDIDILWRCIECGSGAQMRHRAAIDSFGSVVLFSMEVLHRLPLDRALQGFSPTSGWRC